jgi:hypothetical protein
MDARQLIDVILPFPRVLSVAERVLNMICTIFRS